MKLITPDLWPLARTGQRLLTRTRKRQTQVQGRRLVWLERGKPGPGGPTVVLLHGFASMKENWGPWLPLLPEHWHLLVPDLPGLGESDYHPGENYTYEAQALRLRDWLMDLPVGQIHLVGNSMGSGIASILARRLEPGPASLTLLNSAGIPESANPPPDAGKAAENRGTLLIPGNWQEVYRMFNSVGNGRPTAAGIAMTALLGPDLIARKDALHHIFNNLLADPLAPARHLKQLKTPLQVQWGERDTITPIACLDWLRAAQPDADYRVFKGIGHLPMLETPGKSARALAEFVRQHGD